MARNRRYREKVLSSKHIRRAIAALSILCLLLFSGILIFENMSPQKETDPELELLADGQDQPAQGLTAEEMAATGDDASAEDETPGVHQGAISDGDTAGALLQEWLPYSEVHVMIDACEKVYSLSKLRAGQPYVVTEDENGFARFEYEVDEDHRLVVVRDGATFVPTLEKIEYEVRLEKVEASIDSSLFLTMSQRGESAVLAVKMADIFAWEINFIRDVQPGDSFAILVEKRYRDGQFSGYGKLLAAEFVNQGSKYEAYAFSDSMGITMYYNAAGESVKRAFLKAPLAFTRISSQFNLKRVHPIFKEVRPHPAVDYAAPKGTPVKAIGNGQVTFRGSGKGAGNYIVLKHFNGYESMYLHLSGFAKGLTQGGKVRQGEVIGYVGSTGYSTGPHLDFRMKQNGNYVNPNALLTPRAEPVNKNTIDAFKTKRDQYREYMNGRRDLAQYPIDKEM